MSEKRFKVAVYDDKAINGFAVLDLQKPNTSKRLQYENVYIGSKVGCEIVCNFGNSLAEDNEQLKQRNTNQYNQLNELWEIIEEENWEKLIAMKKQLKEDEERLQQEWKCYE